MTTRFNISAFNTTVQSDIEFILKRGRDTLAASASLSGVLIIGVGGRGGGWVGPWGWGGGVKTSRTPV